MAKNETHSQLQALHQELASTRAEAARQLDAVRREQEQQTSEYHDAIQARDTAFRAELDTATQRLETAQAHMLQQIDDARESRRRAEGQLAKPQHRHEQLQSEITELRMQQALQTRELAN